MRHNSVFIIISAIIIMLLSSCSDDCNTEPENKLPTCKITLSTGDSVYFSLYDSFSVQVNAEDEDGFITQVRYYVDSIGLDIDDFEPYNYTVQCYKFESGQHTFKAMALDNDGDTSEDSFEFIIDSYPIANFTASANYAAKNTEIFFDASASNDAVDNDSLLLARWDFNGDLFFDTSWSTEKTTSFIYSEIGKFTPVLEIKDSYGFVSEYSLKLIIAEDLFGSNVTAITIPSGSFQMGDDSYSDCPINTVTLTHDYELGKYEVTNKEYCSMLNYALSKEYLNTASTWYVQSAIGSGEDLYDMEDFFSGIYFDGIYKINPGMSEKPALHITWYGAAFYCNMLSEISGLPLLYDYNTWECNVYGETGYRLPTEAEWEYAGRYNDNRIYPWGEEAPTSAHAAPLGAPQDVGTFSPVGDSNLGLCDFLGNALEWCNDWYSADWYISDSNSHVNPTGLSYGTRKVRRGKIGSLANRDDYYPFYESEYTGFRILKTLN